MYQAVLLVAEAEKLEAAGVELPPLHPPESRQVVRQGYDVAPSVPTVYPYPARYSSGVISLPRPDVPSSHVFKVFSCWWYLSAHKAHGNSQALRPSGCCSHKCFRRSSNLSPRKCMEHPGFSLGGTLR